MKINRNNYAEFFIDFFDGNLNDADTALLFTFLENNSDLKAEFDSFEMHTLVPDTSATFANKEELKKPSISLENYQTYLVADLENDLDVHGKQQLDYFIGKNAHVQFEAQLFEKTKLQASTEIFEKKEKLKRPLVIPIYAKYKYQFAVAAAVAMLLLFSQVFFTNNNSQPDTAVNTGEKINAVKDNSEIENNIPANLDEIPEDKINLQVLAQNTKGTSNPFVSIQKASIKSITHIGSNKNSGIAAKLNIVSIDAPVYAIIKPEIEEENSLPVYASVVNEVDNPNTEGQFTQLTNNSLGKITGNALNVDSKRTKSGLLKSWKLQAGNFSITHSKN